MGITDLLGKFPNKKDSVFGILSILIPAEVYYGRGQQKLKQQSETKIRTLNARKNSIKK